MMREQPIWPAGDSSKRATLRRERVKLTKPVQNVQAVQPRSILQPVQVVRNVRGVKQNKEKLSRFGNSRNVFRDTIALFVLIPLAEGQHNETARNRALGACTCRMLCSTTYATVWATICATSDQ